MRYHSFEIQWSKQWTNLRIKISQSNLKMQSKRKDNKFRVNSSSSILLRQQDNHFEIANLHLIILLECKVHLPLVWDMGLLIFQLWNERINHYICSTHIQEHETSIVTIHRNNSLMSLEDNYPWESYLELKCAQRWLKSTNNKS